MKVTDEHVHDSKVLPELVNDIIKLDKKITIGELFADGAYEGNDILGIWKTMELCHALKSERMLELDGKKGASLETCQLYLRKMTYKNGKTAL